MPILKRLSPDLLIHSIVDIHYSSSFPFEFISGAVYKELESFGYKYKKPDKSPPNAVNFQLEHVFQGNLISVTLRSGQLIFNKVKEYPLWGIYFKEIKAVCDLFIRTELVSSFNRVGLRYINKFNGVNIFENLKDEIKVNFSEFPTKNTRITTEINDPPFIIVLNFGTGFVGSTDDTLDIDVIYQGTMDFEKLLIAVNNCHDKEKSIFQNILKAEFLETLNPVFE